MKTIGLITYLESPTLTPSDQLLVSPLEKEGVHVIPVAWNDPQVNWRRFDALIFRSCWNYHKHYNQFLSWLKTIENLPLQVWNPIPIIRWNISKKYLLGLEKKGIPIIPTIIVNKNKLIKLGQIMTDRHWADIVVKPVVGASADNVFRLRRENVSNIQQKLIGLADITDIIVQPFMPEIAEGEFSLIFIGGLFSHAILKRPRKNDFRTTYRHGGRWVCIEPQRKLLEQAYLVLQTIKNPLLYARVDGIIQKGTFLLMELELIDPHLFFDFDPESSVRFAKTVTTYLR